jgi:anti-sigma factor RsiW
MQVTCSIEETELENDEGREISSVCATCSRCDHETTAYGTSDRSVKRALVMMREECPNGEDNFYVSGDD